MLTLLILERLKPRCMVTHSHRVGATQPFKFYEKWTATPREAWAHLSVAQKSNNEATVSKRRSYGHGTVYRGRWRVSGPGPDPDPWPRGGLICSCSSLSYIKALFSCREIFKILGQIESLDTYMKY